MGINYQFTKTKGIFINQYYHKNDISNLMYLATLKSASLINSFEFCRRIKVINTYFMKKALIVGIDHYNAPIENLIGCNAAANTIGQLLKTNYSKNIEEGTPNFGCRVLTSQPDQLKGRITRAVLKDQIRELFEDENADTALFFFSGYGFENSLGGYLMTQDSEEHEEGVSFNDIMIYANNSSIKEIIIVLDTYCKDSPQKWAIGLPAFAALRRGISILTVETATLVESGRACRLVFPKLFCHVLESGGDDDVLGEVTLGEVYAYADRVLQPIVHQVTYKTNTARMTVLRKAKPQIEYATLKKMLEYFHKNHYRVPLDPLCLRSQNSTDEVKIARYKDLQKMVRCGLAKPINEEHMYYAALYNQHCGLTEKGKQYWNLLHEKRI